MYFCYLAGQADHIIQPGGFQQDALKRLAGTQPRRAVRFRPSVPNTIRQWLRLDCLNLGSHPFPATSKLEPEPQARNWHRYAELRVDRDTVGPMEVSGRPCLKLCSIARIGVLDCLGL